MDAVVNFLMPLPLGLNDDLINRS